MAELTYRVEMLSVYAVGIDDDGKVLTQTHNAVDSAVPASMLDAYVADARTRWQQVEATLNPISTEEVAP